MAKDARKKANWTKMRKEYISSDISIREIAEKYGVSRSQVANHSREEKWVEKRKQYQNKVVTKSLARQEEKDVDHMLQIKSAVDKMADSINEMMKDGNQFRRHISKEKGLIVGEAVMKKYDTQAIRDVTAALKDLSVAIKNMYEETDEGEKEGGAGVIILAPRKESKKKEIFLEEGSLDGE